jgi:hypothetical protein
VTVRFLLTPQAKPGNVGQLCTGIVRNVTIVEQNLRLISEYLYVKKLPCHVLSFGLM